MGSISVQIQQEPQRWHSDEPFPWQRRDFAKWLALNRNWGGPNDGADEEPFIARPRRPDAAL